MSCEDRPDRAHQQLATIGADLLRRLVPMPDAIQASRRAFVAADAGEVTGPLRSSLSRHRVLVMPVEHVSGSALVKVISLHEDGWAQGLPSIDGTVLWIDGASGRITAQVDAGALTALRTGAASGLATDLLAHPASHVLAMLGAGGQAFDQVAGVCAVRPIREVRVHSRRAERSQELCDRLRASHPEVRFTPSGSARQAVDGADVICTATRSTRPLFEPADVKKNVHINAIGAYRLDMREVPSGLFAQAGVAVIDQLDAALAEAGDVVAALEDGSIRQEDLVEIGPLLSGPPVTSEVQERVTIFKSVGVAAQDWSVCELAVERLREASGA
ncbi:MAG TPA: ornithine cyclodeaminase family protein [Streptosporangiaceae bacterium]|nr:ornithine cyclodeaminase family protein [Streptosporangiaceae bacterium]